MYQHLFNQMNYKDLKKLMIELNVRAEEFTEACNEIEACIQEGEDIPDIFVTEYESTVEKLMEFKRNINIKKELLGLQFDDNHSLSSRKSDRSQYSHNNKEERQKKAIVDAKVLEMKVQKTTGI
ncbi:hypothetical protein LOTGIDRAFT_161018 [Lottia gigantea]|uniref:Uncharacterized protein n=1 Tax=Lottia gigantea TaxID=225164 RepID=V4C021_LOTGI|nr:hypothetical protein LOTGIDRAFT_161018 [Lottia gigantea]ESO94769.1 hypothetical protein LOTGIDRAFT_161018 [Lottia gigantea]